MILSNRGRRIKWFEWIACHVAPNTTCKELVLMKTIVCVPEYSHIIELGMTTNIDCVRRRRRNQTRRILLEET
jgi:hypothetical protein